MKIETGSVWRWRHKPSSDVEVLEIFYDANWNKMVAYRDNYSSTINVVNSAFFAAHFEPIPEKDCEAECECSALKLELAQKDQQIVMLKEKLAKYKEALSIVRNVSQNLMGSVDEMLFCMENE